MGISASLALLFNFVYNMKKPPLVVVEQTCACYDIFSDLRSLKQEVYNEYLNQRWGIALTCTPHKSNHMLIIRVYGRNGNFKPVL